MRDNKSQRGAAIPDNVWRNLPSELENANAYLDTKNNTVLYAIDLGSDLGKVVAVELQRKNIFGRSPWEAQI